MNLLILILLISVTAEPIDSLEGKTCAETRSEGENDLEYTFGIDSYSKGFNNNSISTNIPEENIDVSGGTLELKIKLLSLPMRGGKEYPLYLYRFLKVVLK